MQCSWAASELEQDLHINLLERRVSPWPVLGTKFGCTWTASPHAATFGDRGGQGVSLSLKGGMSVVGVGHVQQQHPPHPPLAVLKGQCRGGFPYQKQTESMGVQVGPGLVLEDSGNIPDLANLGCICIHGYSKDATVHDMVSGPGSNL